MNEFSDLRFSLIVVGFVKFYMWNSKVCDSQLSLTILRSCWCGTITSDEETVIVLCAWGWLEP